MTAQNKSKRGQRGLSDYLRDIRVIQAVAQFIFVLILMGLLAVLWMNILGSLEEKNLAPSFDFLQNRAGFGITESPDWYTSTTGTYGEAFLVGIINTLRVVSAGLVIATVVGVLVGIFLLSNNWLIRTISRVYVELLRNTPLLVQLVLWYFVIMLGFPRDDLTVPQEGVMMLPFRFVLYVLIFLGLWFVSRRSSFPQRVTTGGVGTIVLMELIFLLSGYSTDLMLLFAGIGALLFIISWFVPQEWRSLIVSAAAVPLIQVGAHLFLHLLYLLGTLPDSQAYVAEIAPAIYISLKGFVFPEFVPTQRFVAWFAFVLIGGVAGGAIWYVAGHVTETTGRPIPRGLYTFLVVIGMATVGWLIVSGAPPLEQIPFAADGEEVAFVPLTETIEQSFADGDFETWITLQEAYSTSPVFVAMPQKSRFRFDVGMQVSPEYMALLLGLAIYTSGFIAEIVRAGIQAVPHGQIEAARALGLSYSQTLSRIILPQALRVIIPPMGNQYLNLAKNSSLATVVAFADTYQVGTTMMNQSGQSVTGFTLVLVVYLSMSLIISFAMNMINSRFQLVTR